jgi:hypothetical protein
MKKYIALKTLKPLLPLLKNNLLVMHDNSFVIYEDKDEKKEIVINDKIKDLTLSILLNSVKDKSLFYEIEEAIFTKKNIIEFNEWYNSEEGNRVFPNDDFQSDAIDYWEANIKNQTTYAIILT